MNFSDMVKEAAFLISEQGENPEYDRGIAEIVTFMGGGNSDNVEQTAKVLREVHEQKITVDECVNRIDRRHDDMAIYHCDECGFIPDADVDHDGPGKENFCGNCGTEVRERKVCIDSARKEVSSFEVNVTDDAIVSDNKFDGVWVEAAVFLRYGDLVPKEEEMCQCKFCDNDSPVSKSHLHQEGYVCDGCWDERLRTTE